jgi:hypothetical protein
VKMATAIAPANATPVNVRLVVLIVSFILDCGPNESQDLAYRECFIGLIRFVEPDQRSDQASEYNEGGESGNRRVLINVQ